MKLTFWTLSWSKPGAHPEALEWEESYGSIFADFSKRLESVPPEMTDEPDYESLFQVEGFEIIEQINIPLRIPIGGPEGYWAWTQTHGARWLSDQLGTSDADEFKSAVIESLSSSHPTRGNDIMVAPLFTKLRRI